MCPPNLPDPSSWIQRFSHLIGDPVLDLACGRGRHLRWLLAHGHTLTGVDRDVSGLADIAGHARVEIVEADLEAPDGGWPLGARTFATVIVANYLWRPLLPHLVGAVADGGTLLYETFALGNATFGRPSNPDFLLRPDELADAVAGELQIVAFEQGRVERPRDAIVQRICAVRGGAPVMLEA